jgi:hypothetical protein
MTSELEKQVLGLLADAWNAYTMLPVQHRMELDEFCAAIHRAQDLIAVRVARRADPEAWPTRGA